MPAVEHSVPGSLALHTGTGTCSCETRARGLRTDTFDASDIASCRMYARSLDVWTRLLKNVTEGNGSPAMRRQLGLQTRWRGRSLSPQ